MSSASTRRPVGAHYALPAGFAGMLAVGTIAAALRGALPAVGLLVMTAVLVTALSAVTQPWAAPLLGLVGWLTVVGFSRPPYGQLRPAGPLAGRAAITMAAGSLVAAGIGMLARRMVPSLEMRIVESSSRGSGSASASSPAAGAGIGLRRRIAGVLLGAALLPLATVALAAARAHLTLDDEALVFLLVAVAVAMVGGFWPAVLAAITASQLLNWYFTPPLHTFTIDKPQNLMALMLFVTVAVTVSSVVHLAARRAVQAARSAGEAASLLTLAQTVLGGVDNPRAVLDHLVSTLGGGAELLERVAGEWVRVASSGEVPAPGAAPGPGPVSGAGAVPGSGPVTRVSVRDGLILVAGGQTRPPGPRLLDGFAAQAAAALDRERLRTQAAQAEALAEGNRMRNALLAAVSHDLRTPLASIKASVSTLRQPDVQWTPDDEAELLATIEGSADRLNALIGNLLDMSRLRAASLQPFLRPAAIDEVAPLALRGLEGAGRVLLLVPDGLPLVNTDAGLLERILANLLANALAHSPPDLPPQLRARQVSDTVVLEVVDHGPGVPDAWKQRMFEPFERLEARGSGTGVGLGLAVAKGFAEAMGAMIEAADTPGSGLTMRVTLPAAGRPANSQLLADR